MTYKLRTLKGASNLSEQTAAILRDGIKSGEIRPSTHLVEQEIADQLGISRIPVRRAIEQLVAERLVEKDPHRGAFVHPYSRKELEEVYALRVLLESVVVERVMANWSTAQYEQLGAIVDAMVEAGAAHDNGQLDDLDRLFHETLWMLAQQDVLAEMLATLRERSHLFYFVRDPAVFPKDVDFIEAHRSLLTALNSRNVSEAQDEMKRHINNAKRTIQDYYAYLEA